MNFCTFIPDFKMAKNMFKKIEFFVLVLFSTTWAMAQHSVIYYKVPELVIENVTQKPKENQPVFGYNIKNSPSDKMLTKGFYIWANYKWFVVTNIEEILPENNSLPEFVGFPTQESMLLIEDFDGAVYTYPIQAIEQYKMDSFEPENVLQTKLLKSSEFSEKEADTIETNAQLIWQDVAEKETMNDSLVSSSLILDVEDIQVETRKVILPYTISKDSTSVEVSENSEVYQKDVLKENKTETTNENQTEKKSEELLEDKPTYENPYELAVSNGFDGTVTEWIEQQTTKGGKTPYQEAITQGFVGSQEQWMAFLWGTSSVAQVKERERNSEIVSNWLNELNSASGYSPYEVALRNGFYGTFTEWVESVIGNQGEQLYNKAVLNGYDKSYKDWIEDKLKASNQKYLKKQQFRENNFIVLPNVVLPLPEHSGVVSEFNLYDYYIKYYGGSKFSSSKSASKIQVSPKDLEYQITWFSIEDVELLEISENGILKYKRGKSDKNQTEINLRYVYK